MHPRNFRQAKRDIAPIAVEEEDLGVGKNLLDPPELAGVGRGFLTKAGRVEAAESFQILGSHQLKKSPGLLIGPDASRRRGQADFEVAIEALQVPQLVTPRVAEKRGKVPRLGRNDDPRVSVECLLE